VVYAHANSKLVGQNMRIMAENFPEFWHVFSASLGGQAVADYYDWPEADGRVRQKYMSCVPVSGSPLRIAATTYIDEFSQPATETGARIDGIFRQARFYQFLALGALALLAIWLALWQAWSLSRPISALTGAAAEIEAGRSPDEPGSRLMALQTVARRRDELGQLGRVFRSMAEQVFAREKHLKQEVQQLRIEIDEARRHQEVKEITESEYFLRLQERVALLRHRHGK
jgi:methyl-accepting chemotaxis protein